MPYTDTGKNGHLHVLEPNIGASDVYKHSKNARDVESFILGGVDKIPFLGQFNLVYGTAMFHHIQDQRRLIQDAYNSLKPGGKFHVINNFLHENLEEETFNNPQAFAVLITTLDYFIKLQQLGINVQDAKSVFDNRAIINQVLGMRKYLDWLMNLGRFGTINQEEQERIFHQKMAEAGFQSLEEGIRSFYYIYSLLYSMDTYNMRTLEEVLEDFYEVFGPENIHLEKANNGFPLFAITATKV